jgi:hypothetical protein
LEEKMLGLGIQEILSLIPILCVLLFPLWTLVDVLKGEFSGNNQIIWVLVIILLPLLGSIIYVARGRGQKVLA